MIVSGGVLLVLSSMGCMRHDDFEACDTAQDCFTDEACEESGCVRVDAPSTPRDERADMASDGGVLGTEDMDALLIDQGMDEPDASPVEDDRFIVAGVSLPGPRASAAHQTPHLLVYRADQDEGTLLLIWMRGERWETRVVESQLNWDTSRAGERAMLHAYGAQNYALLYEDVEPSSGQSRIRASFYDASREEITRSYDVGQARTAYTQSFDMFISPDGSEMAFLLAHPEGVEFIYGEAPLEWRSLDLELGEGAYHTPRFIDAATRLCAVSQRDELDCVNVEPLLEAHDEEEDRARPIQMLSQPGVAHYEFFSEKRDHVLYSPPGEPLWQQAKFKMDREATSVDFDIEEQLDLAIGTEISLCSLEKSHDFVLTSTTRQKGIYLERIDGETRIEFEIDALRTSITSDDVRIHHFAAQQGGILYDAMSR